MKKRVQHVFLGVVVGSGICIGGILLLSRFAGNNHEMLYQGRPSSYWLEQINSSDTTASNRAILVLNLQIIPRLIDQMAHDTNDSHFRMELVERLNGLPGVSTYYSPAFYRRRDAAYELAEFGPAANAAIPELIKTVKGHAAYSRYLAIIVLGSIHGDPDEVIPLLLPYLNDDDTGQAAAAAMGNYGHLARAALPKMIPLLSAGDRDLRDTVRQALKNIDPEAANQAGVR